MAALCLFILLALAACRVKPLDPPATTRADATESLSTPEQTGAFDDEPAADYGGAAFKLLLPWAQKFISAESGTEKSDLFEALMMDIHEKFNINIMLAPIKSMADLVPSASAGIYYADVVGLRAHEIVPAASGGFICALDDPLLFSAGMNPLDKKRWHLGVSDKILWDGRQWTTQIASGYDFPSFGTFLIYNKAVASKIGAPNLDSLVETDKWNWRDYLALSELAAGETTDEGAPVWGTILEDDLLPILSNGGQFIEHRDGAWVTAVHTASLNGGLDYLRAIHKSDGLFSGSLEEKLDCFADGRGAFFWITSETFESSGIYRRSEGRCGVLPLPTRGAAQNTVHTISNYRGYAVTTASPDVAKAVAVFNAWALRVNEPGWFDSFARETGLDRADADKLKYRVLGSGVYNNAEIASRVLNAVDELIVDPFLASDGPAYDYTKAAEAILSDLLDQYINAPGKS